MWQCSGVADHSGIGHVRNCLCQHAEKGGAITEAHEKGWVKYYELLILFLLFQDDKGGGGCVLDADPQAHVHVFQVYLAEVDRAESVVCH